MIRRVALAGTVLLWLTGCTNTALGINIGGKEGNITVSPTLSGSLGNVSVSVGG